MKYDIGGINKRVENSKKRKQSVITSETLQIFHVPHYTRIKKYYSHIPEEQLSTTDLDDIIVINNEDINNAYINEAPTPCSIM